MKAVLYPYQFLPSTSLGSSSFNSSIIVAIESDVAGIQLNYTGAPVGSFAVQCSLDQVNWVDMRVNVNGTAATSIPIPASTSPIFIDLIQTAASYLRIAYTRTSGTGSVTGYVTYKRLGD